jgi:hypothetical protein
MPQTNKIKCGQRPALALRCFLELIMKETEWLQDLIQPQLCFKEINVCSQLTQSQSNYTKEHEYNFIHQICLQCRFKQSSIIHGT